MRIPTIHTNLKYKVLKVCNILKIIKTENLCLTVYFCTDNNELKTTNTFLFSGQMLLFGQICKPCKYIDLITNDFFFQDD